MALEDLSDRQIERYARHLVLPEIGEEGQAKLLASRVLVVGAGGLGSPLLLYLAAAGIGTLGVIDDDAVDLSNLQRQVIHGEADIGRPKVESARARLAALDPAIRVEAHACRLTPENAREIVAGYDLVTDGSDTFATRYLVNDACFLERKPLVAGAIMRFDGQLTTYRAYDGTGPCIRCLFGPEPPDPKGSCADVGVLGALAGAIGSLQAIEAVKELLGIGDSLAGRLLLFDALSMGFKSFTAKRDPQCVLCGADPRITRLDPAAYGREPGTRATA